MWPIFQTCLADCVFPCEVGIAQLERQSFSSHASQASVFTTSFASVYPLCVAKAEMKGRKTSGVYAVIGWLTGYSQHLPKASPESSDLLCQPWF